MPFRHRHAVASPVVAELSCQSGPVLDITADQAFHRLPEHAREGWGFSAG
jgi:hypothetical protein